MKHLPSEMANGDQNLEQELSLAFSQEITRAAVASLHPLQEDLAEWLSRLLGVHITNSNFIESLSNGVLPCKLAQLIQSRALEYIQESKKDFKIPTKPIRFRENAPPESFIARDNVATFLSWCREIGLADTCLFETDDLVLQKGPKNVLVCIYELARLGCKYSIEPPTLLKLEKEIEKEERNPRAVSAKSASKKPVGKLDRVVQNIAKNCRVDVHRVSEGRYNICGKLVFIRMLRGKHVMVRVGGGWDTLEHFLIRHEPTSYRRVSRHMTTESGEHIPDDYFVIKGKYKSEKS